MGFAALREVRKTLNVQWYRCPLPKGKLLNYYMKRSDFHGGVQAVGHLLLWCCTGWVARRAWMLGSFKWFAAALWLHGIVGSCFLYAVHELGHSTVFKTQGLNTFFLHVFSLLSWCDALQVFYQTYVRQVGSLRLRDQPHAPSPVQPVPRGRP